MLALVDRLNADPKVHGILVQLPLPQHLAEDEVIEAYSGAVRNAVKKVMAEARRKSAALAHEA